MRTRSPACTRGAGFADLWQNGAILAGLGVFVLLLASARFRKTLK